MIRKLELAKSRLLSDFEPKFFKSQKTYFTKIAYETRTFLTENYLGATNFSISSLCECRTEFSLDGYAYIIKIILNSIYGTCIADIDVHVADGGLEISASRSVGEFTEDEMKEMAEVAKLSNIHIEISPQKVDLLFADSGDRRIIFGQPLHDADVLMAFVYVFFSGRNPSNKE